MVRSRESRCPSRCGRAWKRSSRRRSTQLKNIAALPWCFHHVAVMPDVHLGKGATVGSVIAMKDAVAPAAVGVDIGCGMAARAHDPDARSDLPDIARRAARGDRGRRSRSASRARRRRSLPVRATPLCDEFGALHARRCRSLEGRARKQLGTLGGGNHFIELCLDSRGPRLAHAALGLAQHRQGAGRDPHRSGARKLAAQPATCPIAISRCSSPARREMAAYRRDLFWAQRYARAQPRGDARALPRGAARATSRRRRVRGRRSSCHHNYVAEEVHFGEEVLVTRKGAIRAGAGELGIIPGSMGTRSYIVRGLGNPESFEIASHGAGRRMSPRRGQADASRSTDLREQTAGVECRKDARRARRDPGGLQAHRQGHGAAARPRRGRGRAQAGPVRQGLKLWQVGGMQKPIIEVDVGADGTPASATATTRVGAPAARVWSFIADVDRYPSFVPMLSKVQARRAIA